MMYKVCLALLISFAAQSMAYPTGAPQEACSSLQDEHKIIYPNTYRIWDGNETFSLKMVASEEEDDIYIITIKTIRDIRPGTAQEGISFLLLSYFAMPYEHFSGFMIQVRGEDDPDGDPQGLFIEPYVSGPKFRTLDCSNYKDTVTHFDADPKYKIELAWYPSGVTYHKVRASVTLVLNVFKTFYGTTNSVDIPLHYVRNKTVKETSTGDLTYTSSSGLTTSRMTTLTTTQTVTTALNTTLNSTVTTTAELSSTSTATRSTSVTTTALVTEDDSAFKETYEYIQMIESILYNKREKTKSGEDRVYGIAYISIIVPICSTTVQNLVFWILQ